MENEGYTYDILTKDGEYAGEIKTTIELDPSVKEYVVSVDDVAFPIAQIKIRRCRKCGQSGTYWKKTPTGRYYCQRCHPYIQKDAVEEITERELRCPFCEHLMVFKDYAPSRCECGAGLVEDSYTPGYYEFYQEEGD